MNQIELWGLVTRLIALVILYFSVIPRMFKEVRVADGLITLRRQILLGGIVYTITGTLFLTINTLRTIGIFNNDIVGILSLIAGISSLMIAIVLHLIYSRDYGRLE